MFELLPEPKSDAILALMALFRADTRTNKLDLGVGVYKDEQGNTPVMQAISVAERQLLDSQTTKAYVGPAGSADFCAAMVRQVFGADVDTTRVRAVQAVGGSDALRVLADLMMQARPDASIWVSSPTWPNHVPLLSAAGYKLESYPYYDSTNCCVDIDGMLKALRSAPEGDIVLLHGCCHNPTGADLTLAEWEQVIEVLIERGLMPFVDIAYQGFGDGLDEDAAAVRLMAAKVPEMLVAASCSKNFGMYRERVGAAMLMGKNEDDATRAFGRLVTAVRSNYSMPPDHGANATQRVLTDAQLNRQWQTELESMRVRMVRLRTAFAEAMRKRSNSGRFDFVAEQKGMFSRLPLTTAEIDRLRDEFGIYIVGDGRINVAGLPEDGMDELADAICQVMNLAAGS